MRLETGPEAHGTAPLATRALLRGAAPVPALRVPVAAFQHGSSALAPLPDFLQEGKSSRETLLRIHPLGSTATCGASLFSLLSSPSAGIPHRRALPGNG